MPWRNFQITVLPRKFCTNSYDLTDCQNLWCGVIYLGWASNNSACLLKYKLLYSKHHDGWVYGRERWRTTMIDTMLRCTYSEHCFFLLWYEFDTVGSQLSQNDLSNRLTSLLDWHYWLTTGIKKLPLLYIFWTPTHFSSNKIHVIHFHCLLFTLRHWCISCLQNPH